MARGVVTVKVEGLRELERALGQFTKATARNVLKRVLVKAGEPIADRARQLVPVDEGHLKASIAVSTKKPKGADAGKAAFAAAMRGGASRGEAGVALRAARAANPNAFAEAFVGPGRHPQAIFQEFGTVNHPPQPFVRPAWDSQKTTALDIVRRDMSAEIEKAAQRAARKAARLAAKG